MDVPVTIIGCGPIGLAGALLLTQQGVASVIVERRSELNTHPRSRFVDTNTMELFRQLGIEDAVEATGLGPNWTAFIHWADSLAVAPFASIPSPTFHSVPGPNSPCVPVMTVQDEVEKALMTRVRADAHITVRFDTEAIAIDQSDGGTTVTVRHTETGAVEAITSYYTLGTDGPGSDTRAIIGTRLEAEPRPIHMQDVIFHADLSAQVGERKGSLLYTMPPEGVLIFQPLDGRERWRCQVSIGSPEPLTEDAIADRIRASLGVDGGVEFDILSMRMWQPTPGCVTRFASGRILLAGDAAHVSVPTGGMGNNIGFAGIRNLAWKVAAVINGTAPTSILDTYEIEHRPVALERIAFGVETTEHMGRMMVGHRTGADVAEHTARTRQYADYDHVLLGFELASDLIAPEAEPAPEPGDRTDGFTPLVRSGRRAPHVWVDANGRQSVLDWFGRGYVLLVGADGAAAEWRATVEGMADGGMPVEVRPLPAGVEPHPYRPDEVVLVRPDGIIAGRAGGDADEGERERLLSLVPGGPH